MSKYPSNIIGPAPSLKFVNISMTFFQNVDKHSLFVVSESIFSAESEYEKFSEKKLRTESIKMSELC